MSSINKDGSTVIIGWVIDFTIIKTKQLSAYKAIDEAGKS